MDGMDDGIAERAFISKPAFGAMDEWSQEF